MITAGSQVEIVNHFPYNGLTGRVIEVQHGIATISLDFRLASFATVPVAQLVVR